MTNKEKFRQIFGNEYELPLRQYATKDWWEQEYIAPNKGFSDRLEYGTDGNVYKMTISNGKEFEQDCDKCEYANPCLYCKHEFSLTSTMVLD